jgi:hypothetical protein
MFTCHRNNRFGFKTPCHKTGGSLHSRFLPGLVSGSSAIGFPTTICIYFCFPIGITCPASLQTFRTKTCRQQMATKLPQFQHQSSQWCDRVCPASVARDGCYPTRRLPCRWFSTLSRWAVGSNCSCVPVRRSWTHSLCYSAAGATTPRCCPLTLQNRAASIAVT